MFPQLINPFAWWQWLLLAAVPPAIILLYFLKLKRRPIEVPSTYLWHKSIEDLHVNAIWQRLRRNLLLFLQLLVLFLVLWTVLQPGWQSQKLPGNRFIFLVDDSASMQATDEKPSRLEEAKRQALEMIDQMQSGDVGMVVSFSDVARVEQGFTDNRRQLRRAVEGILPTPRATSLEEALRVAAGLANPPRLAADATDVQVAEPLPATLVVLSDGRFDDVAGFALGNLDPVYKPIGSPDASNVGITMLSVRRHETKPDQLDAFAQLRNFSAKPVLVTVQWLLNGEQVDAQRFEIPPGGSYPVVRSLAGVQSGKLALRAKTEDDLTVDDEAWVAVNQPRRARVLLLSPGNRHLENALKTKAALDLAQVTTEPPAYLDGDKYRQQTAAGEFDLILYDRCQPKEVPRANTLFMGAIPPWGEWSAENEVTMPQVLDVDPAHPLTQWINLGPTRFFWGTPLKIPRGGRTLFDTQHGPLLGLAPREGFEDAVLGCAIVSTRKGPDGTPGVYVGTDWFKHPSFPIFVLNLLQYLGGAQAGAAEGSYRPGQVVPLESPIPGKPLVVRTPSGNTIRLSEGGSGRFAFSGTSELGIYDVSLERQSVRQFAVNLCQASESDIRTRPDINIGRVPVQGQSKSGDISRLEIWRALLLAGLAVLLLEWYIYSRRVSM
jgi:hypothetical protein